MITTIQQTAAVLIEAYKLGGTPAVFMAQLTELQGLDDAERRAVDAIVREFISENAGGQQCVHF